MNQQMIQAINQLKSIRNPQQAAMQVLQNAARQGNQMASGILQNIQSGNMAGVEQTLNNFMGENGLSMSDIKQMFK
nr:MAG TPA: hypothetical protein [Bacteriophage sp.]DAT53756.1 MAG TPA: hypothetical protein [Bacteriophage sp.]